VDVGARAHAALHRGEFGARCGFGGEPTADLATLAGLRITTGVGGQLVTDDRFSGTPVDDLDLLDLRWQLLSGGCPLTPAFFVLEPTPIVCSPWAVPSRRCPKTASGQ